MTKPYPDYECLYRCYSIVAQDGGLTYYQVAGRFAYFCHNVHQFVPSVD